MYVRVLYYVILFVYIFIVVRDWHFGLPKVGISDCRDAEGRRVELPKCRSADVRHFGPPISGNKGIILCSLYIKASEFQCSSVYHWSSLGKDLIFLIHNKDCYHLQLHQPVFSLTKSYVPALVTFDPQIYHNMYTG